ncbi:Lipoyltransferase and lipoate-protein ligase [Gymnopus androsaceus JB14]|uniref:Putative lipoate-protein ligase A n=1 Tax=Gymnopus androsaceus JB14 TaxID=1447944 RepID=A0A6A4IDJ2_9AGAR|nr:Lipoyltransferase and lipoate-protein ligase [Gymnopus androsaceus JB14]
MLSSRLPRHSRCLIQRSRVFDLSRYYSTSPNPNTPTQTPQHSIYVSKSTNPYFNLSFEDWLFRHKTPDEPLLLLYRDDPCVVIGRNQNPWKEVNFAALRATQGRIPFIRRRSGGGTVYHDHGNTNFSIHLPRASFDRHLTAQVILRAVRSLGIDDAIVNDRNDICVGKEKIAYKIVNKRAYHHGTMLISTRLDTLGDLLHSNNTKDETMQTKGVASVRSPVRNLQRFNVTHESFVEAVVREFREEYYQCAESEVQIIGEDEYRDMEYIQKGMLELPSWEWAYGQTPEFTYTPRRSFEWGSVTAKIRSKHGIILDCSVTVEVVASESESDYSTTTSNRRTDSPHPKQDVALKLLQDRRYGFVSAEDIQNALALSGINGPGFRKDIAHWLEMMMNS